jgi:cysteine synthase A
VHLTLALPLSLVHYQGAGTAGTVAGCGEFLKGKNPSLKVMVVEPSESRVLVGNVPSPDGHGVTGIGAGVIPPILNATDHDKAFGDGEPHGDIDMYGHASTPEAIAMADKLAVEEGLLVGPSSGAAVHAAIELAKMDEAAGKTIVVIQASSGIRYVTHP